MQRIAIVGNIGSGKTTLSKQIGARLGLPVHHLDLVQWRPGWQRLPESEYRTHHDALIAEERWVIDGVSYWEPLLARLDAADTILFPDYPLWQSYLWSLRRQVRYALRPRPDLPDGCPMLPITLSQAQMIGIIHRETRPRLLDALRQYIGQKRVVRFTTPTATAAWLATLPAHSLDDQHHQR